MAEQVVMYNAIADRVHEPVCVGYRRKEPRHLIMQQVVKHRRGVLCRVSTQLGEGVCGLSAPSIRRQN